MSVPFDDMLPPPPEEPAATPDDLLETLRDAFHTWTEFGALTYDQIAEVMQAADLLDEHLTGGGVLPASWAFAVSPQPDPMNPLPPRRPVDELPGL